MSWELYYQKNIGRPLRGLYQKAISYVQPSSNSEKAVAMDLGCGIGTEVEDMLQRGFVVYAIDAEEKAIEYLKQKKSKNLKTLHTKIENIKDWPSSDFIFAFHSFPFCEPELMQSSVTKAVNSLKPNGVFAATFFGPEDEWVLSGHCSGISKGRLEQLLLDFKILHLDEVKKIDKTALAGDKFWNVIDVIVKRN